MKKSSIRNILVISIFSLMLFSCHSNARKKDEMPVNFEENIIKANTYLVKKDADIIKGFVKRCGWNMTETKTGLWFEVYQNGTGTPVEKGGMVTLNYKISLLDGTVCYSSKEAGPKTFRVTQGGVESGLEEGVLLLKVGDKARFIMPPHLAHGLIGDQKKIPQRATILYEVEITKFTK